MSRSASISLLNRGLTLLSGPILDKELRVCSRHKRYYVLRSLYLVMMAVLILSVWVSKNTSLGWQNSVYNTSRMAEVGRTVIIAVTWFQFVVTQLAAILFFSNAICDEINRGTLNVLMTTPITAIQVVLGKLLSKLVPLALTLALSLSTLSLIYIFGGVHWEYIISSFFVTLTAITFTGTLTLFFSARVKRPHTVIILMITFLSIYYAIGSSLIAVLPTTSGKGVWLLMVNPMAAMYEISRPRVSSVIASGNVFSWGMHCVIMVAISAFSVAATVIRLRKSILMFAFENQKEKSGWFRIKRLFLGRTPRYPLELRKLPNTRIRCSFRELIIILLLLSGYAAGYICLYFWKGRFGNVIFSTYSMTVWLVVFAKTMVAASTAVTKEKENKTLSALLCCPLKNSHIVMGKARYVFKSNYAGWIALTINAASTYIIYSLFIYRNMNFSSAYGGLVWMSIFSALNVIGGLIFIVGFGLYLSTRLKSSAAAVVSGLLGYLVWHFLRYIVMFIPQVLSGMLSLYMLSYYLHPFLDAGAGLFFIWRAKRSLRKYAFK